MHVGKSSKFCPVLSVHGEEMGDVSEEKYVGDLISDNGKHIANIAQSRSKGIGMVNEILSILNHLCLGHHHFKGAMMLRTAMLHAVLLTNSETWLRLSPKDIRCLERVDEMLIRKLLETPISTPGASLYLETGTVPLKFILRGKRVKYLHHILTRDKEALISQVFWAQVSQPAEGDWCTVVQEDLATLGLGELTFDEISKMSKYQVKEMVSKQMKDSAFKDLTSRKRNLSKMASLEYSTLEMQPYLVQRSTSKRHKQVEFRWRTRMTKVGWNFGLKTKCPLCNDSDDTQDHLLICSMLVDKHLDTQTHPLTKRIEIALRRREKLLAAKLQSGNDQS